MYSSCPYISTILITHQILNIIQGGVVQHVPKSASLAQPEPASPKPRGAHATQKIVDDSDYKRICLCSLLCSWNSSIISDSIHLISPSLALARLSSFLDESSLLCLILFFFFSSSKHTFRHQNQSSDVVTNSFCLVSCQISFQLHFTLST